MKIGLFPGSFNPPHLGHLFIAYDFYESMELDLVYFIPTGLYKTDKKIGENGEHRYKMAQLLVIDHPFFLVSDYEIKQDSINYTYKTIEYFLSLYPAAGHELYLLVGEDWADKLDQWKNYEFIENSAQIVIAKRSSDRNTGRTIGEKTGDRRYAAERGNGKYKYLENRYDVSSSRIRDLIRKQRFYRTFLSREIKDYIEKNQLYT